MSPSARQSGEFVRKAGAFVRRLGAKVKGDGHNEISLALANGSRIVGLPGKEETVRGFKGVFYSRLPCFRLDVSAPRAARENPALWSSTHTESRFLHTPATSTASSGLNHPAPWQNTSPIQPSRDLCLYRKCMHQSRGAPGMDR